MSKQDALTRLEAWLRDSRMRYVKTLEHYTATGFRLVLARAAPYRSASADHPTLSTAINAALDRAEEAGL